MRRFYNYVLQQLDITQTQTPYLHTTAFQIESVALKKNDTI